jgi:NAD(P)-dependent dehydrogenase (short-subunit alcohol dehydrogenase family)
MIKSSSDLMQSVLITGANSGIGRTIVEHLRQKEIRVYATARKTKDIEQLEQLEHVTALKLDVTLSKDVHNAVDYIEKQETELIGIVNNAGICDVGPIYNYSIQAIKEVFEVNLFGVMRVTHAFLPLLRQTQGRIVIISSMSGILSGRDFGIYSSSKHAIEAYGDTLNYDLKDTGIQTCLIEPGNFQSNMFKNLLKRLDTQDPEDHKFQSENEHQQFLQRLKRYISIEHQYPTPEPVAEAVEDALISPQPKNRYLVGPKQETDLVINRMIIELLQLNNDHANSLSKMELIQRLESKWDEFY